MVVAVTGVKTKEGKTEENRRKKLSGGVNRVFNCALNAGLKEKRSREAGRMAGDHYGNVVVKTEERGDRLEMEGGADGWARIVSDWKRWGEGKELGRRMNWAVRERKSGRVCNQRPAACCCPWAGKRRERAGGGKQASGLKGRG
jgi:hypothetical protein